MVSKEEEVAYFWHTYLWMYFASQAVIGIIIFEYSWACTSRHRESNEEIDASYPTANRKDAKKWKRWHFYPRAMLIMPTRCLLLLVDLLILTLLVRIFCIGHNFKKGPIGGCRKKVIYFVIKWFA